MANIFLENILPGLYGFTIASNQAIDFSGAPSVALPGATTVGGAQTITSASATALAVGPAGTTNPTLQVDSSTTSAATGLKITAAAAAGGLALSVISSGTNENLKIDAKGSGTISIGSVSTGTVIIQQYPKLRGGTGLTAGGSRGLSFGNDVMSIAYGSGVPTLSMPQGSLYLRSDGSSTSTRAYINTDGSTTWTALTTAA